MSRFEVDEPVCTRRDASVCCVIRSRERDLGGLPVRRVLPAPGCRMVGPFVFLDEMGPARLPSGSGMDVPPHPHIGLATLTYLFEGRLVHRDSLGTEQLIEPGAVNLMTAGRGIVHSERTPSEDRDVEQRLHGLQFWIALPKNQQETEPAFEHQAAGRLPVVGGTGCRTVVVLGRFGHAASPVKTPADPLLAIQELEEGATVAIPDSVPQRAVYVVAGRIEIDGCMLAAGSMAVLEPGRLHAIAHEPSRLALLGGEPFARRHIRWNFVHTDADRIDRAAEDWRQRRFDVVPGDEDAFIPLPDR